MWINCKRGILIFSLGLLSPLFLYAQQAATEVPTPLRFDRLSIEDGLSQNDVFTILQDRRGFMWFGTNFGLNRYDGYTFSLYKTAPFDTATLSYNWILALHEDREGKLWVGTLRGLNRMDPSTETVARYVHDPNDPGSLSHDEVWAIHEDRAGTLWIGTSGGLNKRDGRTNRFTPFRHDPTDANSEMTLSMGSRRPSPVIGKTSSAISVTIRWSRVSSGLARKADAFDSTPRRAGTSATCPTPTIRRPIP